MAIQTPLGEDVLLFHRMTASEYLGRLFEYRLEVLSTDHGIRLEDLLGCNATVRSNLIEDAETRYFNGFVSAFSYVGSYSGMARYELSLRPWLWFLTRQADSRIFQDMTIPDIVEKVFRSREFTDYELRLSETHRVWEYCVQYRETDFNFVSRLLELEGIYYFFVHDDGKHTLVLADSIDAHQTIAGYDKVPYYPPEQGGLRERDHIDNWSVFQEIQPGAYTLRDFDFITPKNTLETRYRRPNEHANAEYEIFDYPGDYFKSDDGNTYARFRLEELHSQFEQVRGAGDVVGIYPGGLFELTGYPREDQNREYLVVSSELEVSVDAYAGTGDSGGSTSCRCSFTALDSKRAFRAPRITPKPVVKGPQTAIVTGPAGEEIWTDQYNRVKVHFQWNRECSEDENSSCWIRVSHPWAGKGWGAIAVPRIGHEVIVDFIEGDPDRPIVTGRVYNGEAKPPYPLPDNATQTGIKSRSSKGGTPDNFNEIRFEDKKGEEQVYIHAEKNQDIVVENDETHSVGHDRTKDIGNDETTHVHHDRTETVDNNESITIGVNRTEQVGSDETISIGNDRTENVGNNESITIANNRTEKVGTDESITIGSNRTENVGSNEKISIGANRTENVGKDESITIGAKRTENVGSDESISIGGARSETVAKKESISIGDSRTHSVAKDDSLSVGKTLSATAGDQVVFNTGSASIVMKKNGDITINGKNITIKGSGNVVIKGKKVLEN